MKKTKLLVLIFALVSALILFVPIASHAEEIPPADSKVVKVVKGDNADNEGYGDIQAAITAQTSESDIELQLQDDVTDGKGFIVPDGKTVIIDFNRHTYNVTELVGSEGYESQACQLLKGATVTLKNGTLSSEKALILIQNYSNLTLENMVLDHTKTGEENYPDYPIALSVNNGNVKIEGATSISSTNMALDVYYWKEKYDGSYVTIDSIGNIIGDIYVRSSDDGADNPKNKLTIENINHTSGDLKVSDKSKNNVEISGGWFNYNVLAYVKSGYTCVEKAGNYVVGPKAQNIEVPTSIELEVGNSQNIAVTIEPSDTIETAKFESDNETVATVSSDGKVTGLSEGMANITVKVGDLSKVCVVTVKAPEVPIEDKVDTQVPEIMEGDNSSLNFGVSESNKSEVDRILKESLLDESSSLYSLIKDCIDRGENVSSQLELSFLNEDEIDTAISDAIALSANADQIVQYLDISILVNSNGNEIGKLTELKESIPVTVNIPDDLKQENRRFYILKYHDGNVERLDLVENDGHMEFYTDEFSVYALAYEEVDETTTPTGDVPKTGDTLTNIFAALVIITAIALIVIRIRKKNNMMK